METADYFLKKLSNKVDDVVITINEKQTNQIKFSNNKVVSTKTWDKKSAHIFIAKGKRLATTTVENFSEEAANDVIKNLLSFIKKIKKKKHYYGIAHGPFKYKNIKDGFDPAIVNLQDNAVDVVDRGINAALEQGAKRCDGILEFGEHKKIIRTSNDVTATDRGTDIYFSIRTFIDKHASGHACEFSRTLDQFKGETKAKKAAEIARKAVYPERIAPGKYDVIFSPLAFSSIVQHVGEAASIFSVESGLSFLHSKLKKTVASKEVTISDDGSLENGYHSTICDDEGVPTQRNALIEKGMLKTYLHNTSTAHKHKTTTTANAGIINPSPWNLIVESGNHDEKELFEEVKKGLYITNVWYTRFADYAAGDFSTIPRDGAFFIDNGELKYPVKGIRVSENMVRLLKNISAMSKVQERIIGWEVETPVLSPMVLAKNINISTSTH